MNAEDFRLRVEFRLQDEFRLRDRISSSARPKPNFVFTRISSSGPIFVFKYRLRAQFELQLLANNFVFKSFGISASGGDETGTQFPGSMHIYVSMNLCIYVYILSIYTAIQTPEVCAHSCTAGRRRGSHLASYELSWVVRHHYSTHRGCCRQSLSCTFV